MRTLFVLIPMQQSMTIWCMAIIANEHALRCAKIKLYAGRLVNSMLQSLASYQWQLNETITRDTT
jgi:hypothetical protein